MAWQRISSPAILAIIGDALPPEHRAMGFTVRSILKRVAIVGGPLIDGIPIAKLRGLPLRHRGNSPNGCGTLLKGSLICEN